MPDIERGSVDRRDVWLVERQAFGGDHWDRITFGPFADRDEAQAFVDDAARQFAESGYIGHPGYVVNAR